MPVNNKVTARGTNKVGHTVYEDMNYLARLPPVLRNALNDYIQLFSAVATYTMYKSRGAVVCLQMLREVEIRDVRRFAVEYERKYKLPYPHTAANASIMRYGRKEPYLLVEPPLTRAARRNLRRANQPVSHPILEYNKETS